MNKASPKVLIVDNDADHSSTLAKLAKSQQLEPLTCASLAQAEKAIGQYPDSFAAAFVALDLPDGEGLDLLKRSDLLSDETEVALLHNVDDPERASLGISLQARYFFCKPVDENFAATLLGDIRDEWTSAGDTEAEAMDSAVDQFGLMRGNSRPMRKLYRTLRKVAPTKATVLLIGESGTGKELAAETIHLMSNLDGPFVAINCGAIPAELAESELFGHEKGSFSGADRKHAGCFERAEGGTLFLDELGEMPLDIQVKLLRVLETGTYRRVGGEQELNSNVRIIAATNRELEEAVQSEMLREDLYFRIAQFPLHLPPLRDREGDVVGLAKHFLNSLNEEHGTAKVLTHNAIEAIGEYPWPGNVRELRSALERAYIMAENQLKAHHFPLEQMGTASDGDFLKVPVRARLEDTEKRLILAALEAVDGNKKEAAEQLGISLKTLYNRLKEYDEEGAA